MNKKGTYGFLGVSAIVFLAAGSLVVMSRARATAPAGAPAPPEVQVAVVQQRDLPIEREWVGTLAGIHASYVSDRWHRRDRNRVVQLYKALGGGWQS